ncbi:hypothetical protein NQ036_03810 [Brevibacterium sp. 91QC2O2]|uniref:hypothetical protein n=1 Tax=Brevibacterium TaxID=1696 RepID=UPI00211C6D1C|nr:MULTISPECIES: hypothetical protein [unclassified Brevibacterium]MCQ9367373.1 hypothetical protein [Brevibacterium sp. 91QC2O2]MCQ9384614.1 hypothetical protein [Brevibacterium sp. 68QC2CO]
MTSYTITPDARCLVHTTITHTETTPPVAEGFEQVRPGTAKEQFLNRLSQLSRSPVGIRNVKGNHSTLTITYLQGSVESGFPRWRPVEEKFHKLTTRPRRADDDEEEMHHAA